jgi:hypothetical protein
MNIRRSLKVGFTVLTIATAFPAFFHPLQALTVLPLSLSKMTHQSGKIFYGHCLGTSVELDENRIPSTYVRFQVMKGLKGVQAGEETLVKIHGVSSEEKHPLRVMEGEQAVIPAKSISLSGESFKEGEDYFLFFYPDSRLGFTSPVGGGQGRFDIQKNEQKNEAGGLTVMNPLGNAFLSVKSFGLPDEGGPVGLNRMMEKVQEMVNHDE